MTLKQTDIQNKLLKIIAKKQVTSKKGAGKNYINVSLESEFPEGRKPTLLEIMEAVNSIVVQELAVIDYSNRYSTNWTIFLTNSGLAAAQDQTINPDNSSEYLEILKNIKPKPDAIVLQYVTEAVTCYKARCYLGCAVMLGVASESAFLNMAFSFGKWLKNENEKNRFLQVIENKRQNYISKFNEFRKRIEKYKPEIPDELSDGMALTFDSILDLLRIYRNEAGHPTGKKISRDDAFISLQMFVRYLQKMYLFKDFFNSA